MKSIFLIGFMGAGKTTVGKFLAEKLRFTLIDTDSSIEIEQGNFEPNNIKRISESDLKDSLDKEQNSDQNE